MYYIYICIRNLASSATDSANYSLTDFLSLDMSNKVEVLLYITSTACMLCGETASVCVSHAQ